MSSPRKHRLCLEKGDLYWSSSPFRYLIVAFNFLTTLTKFNQTQKGCKCCGKKKSLPTFLQILCSSRDSGMQKGELEGSMSPLPCCHIYTTLLPRYPGQPQTLQECAMPNGPVSQRLCSWDAGRQTACFKNAFS